MNLPGKKKRKKKSAVLQTLKYFYMISLGTKEENLPFSFAK